MAFGGEKQKNSQVYIFLKKTDKKPKKDTKPTKKQPTQNACLSTALLKPNLKHPHAPEEMVPDAAHACWRQPRHPLAITGRLNALKES